MIGMRNKRNVDERIETESNKLNACMFYVITALIVISLLVKIICKLPVYVYVLEMACLLVSTLYVLINKVIKKTLIVERKDEVLSAINRSIFAKAFMLDTWMIIIGELVFIFTAKEYFFWVISYLAIFIIPALISTILSIKRGWLIWGSKKREEMGKKKLIKSVIIGALFFGVFMAFPELYHDGSFHAEGILWLVGLGAGWGIMFYLIFSLLIEVSEKSADKSLREKENEVEE